jgi:hypothetical protein
MEAFADVAGNILAAFRNQRLPSRVLLFGIRFRQPSRRSHNLTKVVVAKERPERPTVRLGAIDRDHLLDDMGGRITTIADLPVEHSRADRILLSKIDLGEHPIWRRHHDPLKPAASVGPVDDLARLTFQVMVGLMSSSRVAGASGFSPPMIFN